jgi:hypothetical protein
MLRFALHHTVRGFAQHDSLRLARFTYLRSAALVIQEDQFSILKQSVSLCFCLPQIGRFDTVFNYSV